MADTENELTPTQSWNLLATSDRGRLAMCFDGAPEIFPVTYVLANGTVVFRTAAGRKHVSARLGHNVALEADGVDTDAGLAWSVVVKGHARDVTSRTELDFVRSLPLHPAHGGAKYLFVRIEPDSVTGRRFPIAARSGLSREDEGLSARAAGVTATQNEVKAAADSAAPLTTSKE